MHYIRFLKPPRFIRGPRSPPRLEAKITITTDLGESFLAADVILVVETIREVDHGNGWERVDDGPGNVKEFRWLGSKGMRALEIIMPFPRPIQGGPPEKTCRMYIKAKDENLRVDSFGSVMEQKEGGIVGVGSVDLYGQDSDAMRMAERVFSFASGEETLDVCVWEETGESIARHIWDAGVVLSSYLASVYSLEIEKLVPRLPVLEKSLSRSNVKVLELGAGCGIVGITLSQLFNSQISQVILTDLPEATEILTQNLSPSVLKSPGSDKITHQVLDWSSSLPSDIKSIIWDIILVADCTYNPDVVPDLVKTVRELVEMSNEAVILLAMKVRHDSELIFFDLMEEKDLVVKEKIAIPLPVLGGEDQEIEIFVFGLESTTGSRAEKRKVGLDDEGGEGDGKKVKLGDIPAE